MALPKPGVAPLVGLAAVVVLLPWLGARWRNPSLASAAFVFPPPLDIPQNYPRWSWVLGLGVLIPFAMLALAWWRHRRQARAAQVSIGVRGRRPIPSWGTAALLWTSGCWYLAWTRFDWFAGLQPYTFFPLWLGFTVSVNAATYARGGKSLLCRHPGRWTRLFLASAAFWWGLEWLNRFVRNWHYLGVQDFGPVAYVVHASLCFSTVLPAVLGVCEFLQTIPSFQLRLANGPPLRWLPHPLTGGSFSAVGIAALVMTGAFPQQCYPAVWLAPLLLVVGLNVRTGRSGWWNDLAAGDWRRAGSWAAAAFVCGAFWELWNYRSAAKWIYTLPYADHGRIFEMPLLGYLGYFGFGLECCAVAEWVLKSDGAHHCDLFPR